MLQDNFCKPRQGVAVVAVRVTQVAGRGSQCGSCPIGALGGACDQLVIASRHRDDSLAAMVDLGAGHDRRFPFFAPLRGSGSAQEGERRMRSVQAVRAPGSLKVSDRADSRTPIIPRPRVGLAPPNMAQARRRALPDRLKALPSRPLRARVAYSASRPVVGGASRRQSLESAGSAPGAPAPELPRACASDAGQQDQWVDRQLPGRHAAAPAWKIVGDAL